eukprot:SAG25_NODE_10983_length_317_cov_0.949541_1_plen_44_part_10
MHVFLGGTACDLGVTSSWAVQEGSLGVAQARGQSTVANPRLLGC